MKKYRFLKDSDVDPAVKAGSIVYAMILNSYGVQNDDTRLMGREYTTVTFDPDGGYPGFSAAVDDLEVIEE